MRSAGSMGYIYGLVDPAYPGAVRYVGLTTTSLAKRLASHTQGRKQINPSPVRRWIDDLKATNGRRPAIVELEGDIAAGDLIGAERRWITKLRTPLLLNRRDGGNSASPDRMEEIRKKIGAANKGRKPWIAGRHHTLEARALISTAHKGREFSEEHRRNLSVALKGRPLASATRMAANDPVVHRRSWDTRRKKYGPSGSRQRVKIDPISIQNAAQQGWETRRALYGPSGRKSDSGSQQQKPIEGVLDASAF